MLLERVTAEIRTEQQQLLAARLRKIRQNRGGIISKAIADRQQLDRRAGSVGSLNCGSIQSKWSEGENEQKERPDHYWLNFHIDQKNDRPPEKRKTLTRDKRT